MSNEQFIQGLVATAEPVTRRRLRTEIVFVALIGLVQLLGAGFYFGLETTMASIAAGGMLIGLKLGIFAVLAVSFSGAALWSLDPAARRTAPILMGVLAVVATASFFGFDRQLGANLSQTFSPQWGWRCFFSVLFLAMPVTLALSLFMLRGAPTQVNKTAAFIGLAGGSWGAFTYALHCPFVSLYYLSAWYVGGIALVTLVARLILPRVARW